MKKINFLLLSILIFLLSGITHYNAVVDEISDFVISTIQKAPVQEDSLFNVNSASPQMKMVFESHLAEGEIGIVGKRKSDNPHDNVFSIDLGTSIDPQCAYWLEYEVFGVHASGVARSVNDEYAYGGRFVDKSDAWKSVREQLHPNQLRAGMNTIRFSVPTGADYGYKVRNLQLRKSKIETSSPQKLVMSEPVQFGEMLYLRGYVVGKHTALLVNDVAVDTHLGAFEFTMPMTQKRKKVRLALWEEGVLQYETSKRITFKPASSSYYAVELNKVNQVVEALPTSEWGLELPGIKVHGTTGSVSEQTNISVTALRSMDMPPMGSGMINVTALASGYRLLPHASQFNSLLNISIGIDSTKIPAGYSPKQVRTYYFDESSNRWTVLPNDTTPAEGLWASALTDHFTDFINAIIKSPELPTSQAYTPTMLKDLKAANPLEGVNLISPPAANNNGTANISLPIEVPAGRQGLQPQLALQYSSEGGNGWLGLGWSMSIPAINVDTRWGVPRYLQSVESESYLINGEELQCKDENDSIWPLFHRNEYVPRNTSGTRKFVKRVEGSFNRIIRHGTSPSTYWWEVTDKLGTKYYYGKYFSDSGPNSNCILEKDGKIAYWALAEVRDIHGNFMKYTYNRDTGSGKFGDNTPGRQLYLQNIAYTGYASGTSILDNGKYEVDFLLRAGNRIDTVINARYGFKEVTSRLLERIDVKYDGDVIRSYQLGYKMGSFHKTILCYALEAFMKSSAEIDSVATVLGQANICNDSSAVVTLTSGFKIHRFEYFSAPVQKGDIPLDLIPFSGPFEMLNTSPPEEASILGIEDPTVNTMLSNAANYPIRISTQDVLNQKTPLGTAQNLTLGGSASIYVGTGTNSPKKTQSISGSYSYNWSTSRAMSTMMDIDGDGLPDRVFEKLNEWPLRTEVYYQKLTFSDTNNLVPIFSAPIRIEGLNRIQTQTSNTHGWGLQGMLGITELTSANASAGYSRTRTFTSRYFADINGDGLLDFVDKDSALICQLDEFGVPFFTRPQSDTMLIGGSCGFIVRSGYVNDSVAMKANYNYEPLEVYDDVMQNHQAVRMWIAPYTGSISIYAPIQQFLEHSVFLEARQNSTTADGFRYSIQRNADTLFIKDVLGTDQEVNNDSAVLLQVTRGDRLYFRIMPKEHRNWDVVTWDPEITYTHYQGNVVNAASSFDADGKKNYKYLASEDFYLHQVQEVLMPDTGTVNINGSIQANNLTDTVFFSILKSGNVILQHTLLPFQSNYYSVNFNSSVLRDERLEFKAEVNTRVAYEHINYNLNVDYLSIQDGTSVLLDPTLEFERMRIQPILQTTVIPENIQPSIPITLSSTGSVNITPRLQLNSSASGVLYVSVKAANSVIAEKSFEIVNGNMPTDSSLFFYNSGTNDYFVDFHLQNASLSVQLSSATYKLVSTGTQIFAPGVYGVFPAEEDKFGNLYRGWGQFVFNGNEFEPMDEGLFEIFQSYQDSTDLDLMDSTQVANMDVNFENNQGMQNIDTLFGAKIQAFLEAPFYRMDADVGKNRWYGIGNLTSVGPEWVSNSLPLQQFETAIDYVDNPLPRAVGAPGASYVTKESLQNNWSMGASIGPSWINAGAQGSYSRNRDIVAFIDMNGDRFPDNIGEVSSQYTRPTGGLDENVQFTSLNGHDLNNGINRSWSWSLGANIGGKMTHKVEIENQTTCETTTDVVTDAALIGNRSLGKSITEYTLMDINGDGLPDRVNGDGLVLINLGYSFTTSAIWFSENLRSNFFYKYGVSGGPGPGVLNLKKLRDKAEGSWTFGVGQSWGGNVIKKSFVDINGDGLVDIILSLQNENKVMINTGNGYKYVASIGNSVDCTLGGKTNAASGSIAGTLGVPLGLLKFGGTLGLDFSLTRSLEQAKFIDVNNDGFVDIVRLDSISGKAFVYYSQLKKVNFLKRVETSVGASFDIEYSMMPSSQQMPQAKWVMESVTYYDGFPGDGTDTSITVFSYGGGKYDRYERVFLGYDTVHIKQLDTNYLVYRHVEKLYHTNDFLFKGLQFKESVRDQAGNAFSIKETTYAKKTIDSGKVVVDSIAFCFGPYFPAIHFEDNFVFENSLNPIHIQKEFIHGPFGNVVEYINHGNVAYSDDDLRATITYKLDTAKYFLVLVDTIRVYNGSNQLMRHRIAAYDGNTGSLLQIKANIAGNTFAQTDFEYDQYGNVSKQIMPPNSNNQRYELEYAYDNVVHIFPVEVTDIHGYTSETDYDYLLSKPIETRDISGNRVVYSYNSNGRLSAIRGPKEIAASKPFTLKFNYWDDYEHTFPSNSSSFVSLWARTTHYDPANASNTIPTVLFADGSGKVLQTKKKSTVAGQDIMIVSGRQTYDTWGRVTEAYFPLTEVLGADSIFNGSVNNTAPPTKIDYDILDREILVVKPDLTRDSILFSIDTVNGGMPSFVKTVYDALDNAVSVYSDHRGLQLCVKAPQNISTRFVYNALGELVESIDPDSNSTLYYYDRLGRRYERHHPDAGITHWQFDGAGNLITQYTANLSNTGMPIEYEYHFNQLTRIVYPEYPENNVYYEYGHSGNETGKIAKSQDASGIHAYTYGNMGELIEKRSTAVVPVANGVHYTFTTSWKYDSWNRVQQITYPDGDLLSYGYDNGGQLINMHSSHAGQLIESITYDAFGSRLSVNNGNGTHSNYAYNPTTRRLSTLETYDGQSNLLHDLVYSYDLVGNITKIENVNPNSTPLGGQYAYNYTYDDLYRLTSSDGHALSLPYELGMTYSASGNIVKKALTVTKDILGNSQQLTYDNRYSYTQGHQVAEINDHSMNFGDRYFEYDLNGNMIRQDIVNDEYETTQRTLCWDEENRLAGTSDNNYVTANIYDAGGQRHWKLAGQSNFMWVNGQGLVGFGSFNLRTWYPSELMTVTDQAYTKHYFSEGQRVASALGNGFGQVSATSILEDPLEPIEGDYERLPLAAESSLRRTFDCLGLHYENYEPMSTEFELIRDLLEQSYDESDVYFYHSDHLGSSSFITDGNGDATQHLQYLPFGEDFIHQQSTSAYYTPFTFSGKERDMETSLSYFGARYYDAGLSIWLSVDPLSDKYPSLSAYNYTMNNPVILGDPDGRSVICETCPEGEEWDAFRNDNANWHYNAESNTAISIQNGEINISSTVYDEKVDGEAHNRYFSNLQAEAVIEALVMLGFDRDMAAQDVKAVNRYHAQLQNSEFYTSALPMEAFDSKNWKIPARQSNQLGNSLYALKLYPGRNNSIGLVYADSYYHTLEAGAEVLELFMGSILGPHYMHENNALGFLKTVK